MAVAFRAISAQADSFNTTLTISKPTGTTNGDVMLAAMMGDGTSVTVTPPSGWTLLDGPVLSGTSADLRVYYKVAASEPTSWTWTSSVGLNWMGVALAYSGAATINQHANVVTTAGINNPVGATVTPTLPGCMIVEFMALRATPFPATAGSGLTERMEMTSVNLGTLAGYVEDVLQGAAAAISPDATFSGSGGSGWATVTVAIAPPSAGPTNTVAPVVSGVEQVGRTLTTTSGTWV